MIGSMSDTGLVPLCICRPCAGATSKSRMRNSSCWSMRAVLAALRDLSREWTLDLHALPTDTRVHPVGQTHYWWPPVQKAESEERSG
jgi:hypothetical protein